MPSQWFLHIYLFIYLFIALSNDAPDSFRLSETKENSPKQYQIVQVTTPNEYRRVIHTQIYQSFQYQSEIPSSKWFYEIWKMSFLLYWKATSNWSFSLTWAILKLYVNDCQLQHNFRFEIAKPSCQLWYKFEDCLWSWKSLKSRPMFLGNLTIHPSTNRKPMIFQ